MNKTSIDQAKDRDIANSITAMRRAAKRAGQVAAQTGTSLIIWHDGHVERVAASGVATQAADPGIQSK